MSVTKVAEVLAALSLTTDLASGVPVEKGLRHVRGRHRSREGSRSP